ncbi:MAG: FtsX-like permease family protein [Bacteroidota bacterium]|nr:FtsX-like permease family protein [Bacteroidota bacterium]
MYLPSFIARRYLFSKNNRNAINIISFIAVVVLTVATAALIIVLSIFNGIDKVISEKITTYAPDLKLLPVKGKTLEADSVLLQKLKTITGIEAYSLVLEENVLIKSQYKQLIAVVKGVDDNYSKINDVSQLVYVGEYGIKQNSSNGVFGYILAAKLGVTLPAVHGVSVWIPNRKNISTVNPQGSFKKMPIIPVGVAEVEETFNNKYVLISLSKLQKLTERSPTTVSAIEIKAASGVNPDKLKKKIVSAAGNNLVIKNRVEQYDVLYSVMRSEKLATFLILIFIILIAGFSITGSIIMLIIEKKKDMQTLISLGLKYRDIQKIFLTEGMMITLLSGLIGLTLGGVFSYLQQEFGFISYSMGAGVEALVYPVQLKSSDFIYSFVSVAIIGTVISIFPVLRIRQFLSAD